jgi:eukaryotic-like serine/threonine-protein kinase
MDLTPEQWDKIKALFEEALEKPSGERPQFLASATAEPLVRDEARRLLASHSEAGNFLSASPVHGALDPPTAGHPAAAFQSGDLLAGRFRIVRFLARGGMGEVYEAEDQELREPVALKVVRPDLLRDPRAADRFRREVHLAKKVTHPNVCRIFDIFRHQPGPGTSSEAGGSILFVAMELLLGETLAQCLRESGRMKMEQALPLAVQMAAGLGAAHEAGVLHRDFKPGNVVLVSSPKGMRAVITDFGLALRASVESTLSGSLTETGKSFGTPAYMSPEQVEGKELTPASDVYSLGLVLYQMVTGARPFEDTTALSMAVRRLHEDPAPPRTLVRDLDPHYEAVVLRCLERDVRRRFADAGEVARVLRREVRVSRRPPRWVWAAVAALLVVAMIAALVLGRTGHKAHPQAGSVELSTVSLRRSVAVLPLKNLSGRSETGWVAAALAEMLSTELEAGEKLRVVPGENVVRVTSDLGIGTADTLGRDTLGRLRQSLGSDVVVVGSYLDVGSGGGGQIRLDLRLQDTLSGDTVSSVTEKGSEARLDELVTQAGTDLRSKLGVGDITPSQAASLRASLPKSTEATQLYAEGLAKLRVFDALGARAVLEKAIGIEPGYSQAHSALADAWTALGYDRDARREAQKAYQLSAGLPREQRLWIEARTWEAKKDWDKAARAYRSLFDFFPDNVDYGLSLAGALTRGGKANDALTVIAALHKLPPPAGDDPRIDLAEGAAYDTLAAFQEEETAAGQAADKARILGARLLLARALDAKSRSYGNRGLWSKSGDTAAEARQIYSSAGDREGVARSLRTMGIVLYKQGHFGESAKTYQEALQIQREIGSDGEAAVTLNDLATAMWDEGDWSGSQSMYQQAVDLFRRVGNQAGYAGALGNLAGILMDRGDLPGARQMYEEGLRVSRQIGDKSGEGFELVNLADILAQQGKLGDARKTYERAANLFRDSGDQSSLAYPLAGIAEVLMAQDQLSAAAEQYAQALKLRQQAGEQAMARHTRLEIAELLLEQGKPTAEVEASVLSLLSDFRKGDDAEGQMDAATLLALILLAERKFTDAQSAASAAQVASARTQNYAKRTLLEIVQARVAAQNDASGAEDKLQKIAEDCRRRGFVQLQLEAELALGEARIETQPAAGATQLERVQREAASQGYRLIARKATAGQK